jgi:hypothetical protein
MGKGTTVAFDEGNIERIQDAIMTACQLYTEGVIDGL